jgi:hypothetical protein
MIPADPYDQVEAGIADRLRAELAAEFFTNRSTHKVEDWRVSDNDSNLERGADFFVVMRPGAFPSLPTEYSTGKWVDMEWETFVRLYVKYTEREEQWSTFKTFRWAAIATIRKHRSLSRVTIDNQEFLPVPGVDRVRSVEASDPAGYWWIFEAQRNQGLPPNYMFQALRVVTRQRVKFE